MRMMLEIDIPNEPFNTMVRNGTVGQKLQKILESNKPQAAYFSERDGRRGGILIVDVAEPSAVPGLAEPWFLTFNAECRFRIVMSPEDLGRAGLDQIAKAW